MRWSPVILDRALTVALFLLTVLLFGPLTYWLARQTHHHGQLNHALLILGLAVVFLLTERRNRLSYHGAFSPLSTTLLMGSFVLLGAATGTRLYWLFVASYVLAGAAWGLFFFGPRAQRAVFSLAGAAGAYGVLAALVQYADWPLRAVAGRYSQWVLEKLGFAARLYLDRGDEARLVLTVGPQAFEVAPECNGFGLIGASLLLALLLVIYRRVAVFDKVLCVIMSVFLAVLFNVLRIITICLLAPHFPGHYPVLHEIVGNVFFWAGLASVWGVVCWVDGDRDVAAARAGSITS
ncbi:MAG: exosortase/archaeosortase family protein [Candidatus Methylacidiphilales bacterium]|nr:exosortase/archaeosortase family protein [Candidatus Methylacidiphilales bacterium]